MNDQFLQMQYEYYRQNTPTNYMTFAQYKEKITSCTNGGGSSNKYNYLPWLIGGLVVGYFLKK